MTRPLARMGGAGQFLFGPKSETATGGWRTEAWGEHEVSAHPDLPVTVSAGDSLRLLLIGYAIDPLNHELSNAELLDVLQNDCRELADVMSVCEGWTGRWVLAVDDGVRCVLIPDATSSRQVHVALDAERRPWCASTASRLAHQLGLVRDDPADNYVGSVEFRGMWGGAWMPGDSTRWVGCQRLLPNHLVDLQTGRVCRVPIELPTTSMEHALDCLAETVRGAILGAAHRHPLTFLVTAGMDSRVLFAAARPVIGDLLTVSISNPEGHEEDVLIPQRFCQDLGVAHATLVARRPGAEFAALYGLQDGPANQGYIANAAALLPVTAGRMAVTGHVAGLFKRPYGGARFARRPTPGRLALEMQMGTAPFAVAAQSRWLHDAGSETSIGHHDLAYWEQKVGSWAAGFAFEYDVSWADVLWPYSSKRLITTLLALGANGQRNDRVLWRKAIEDWWPELLHYPAGGNPVRKKSIRSRVRRSLTYMSAR